MRHTPGSPEVLSLGTLLLLLLLLLLRLHLRLHLILHLLSLLKLEQRL